MTLLRCRLLLGLLKFVSQSVAADVGIDSRKRPESPRERRNESQSHISVETGFYLRIASHC